MKKITSAAASAALLLAAFAPVAFVASPALAASPAQSYCENTLRGTYDKSGGEITCTVTSYDTTGTNGHGQPITNTVYYYDNGTWNNDPQSDSEDGPCVGPGNSGGGSAHCR